MKPKIDILLDRLIDTNSIRYNTDFNKVSKIHKYWSRKPWHIIENYVLRYSKKNDTVLDNFCGSGSVGLESVLNERNFIGYDLNPSAIFLSTNTLDLDFNIEEFEKEVLILEKEIKPLIMSHYQICDKSYILYLISGKNIKDYNCVASDFNFKNKKTIINNDLYSKEIENLSFPDKEFPTKFYKDRFSYKGIHKVSDMFSKRNLNALTLLHNYLESKDFKYKNLMMLAFSNMLLHVSMLKAENVRPLSVNNYWIPDDFIEENVIWRFLDRLENIKIAKATIQKRKLQKSTGTSKNTLFNKSSLQLEDLENESIDYVITDPPYGDAIQYSELSYIWNCWLQKEYKIEDEVIINPVQNKGVKEFHSQIKQFIESTKRVLKPNGFFTLCFQNKDIKIWLEIVQTIKRNGFELHEIEIYDTFGSPYNKHWAKFSPKSDLYVTFKNSQKVYSEADELISPNEMITDIANYFKFNDLPFDLHKGYDLFVASLINEVFDNKTITNYQSFDLKKVVSIFEKLNLNGVKQERSFAGFQAELSF